MLRVIAFSSTFFAAFVLGCSAEKEREIVPATESIPAHVSGSELTASDTSIVWVTIDTVRADHLSAYGYFRNTSPRFDALAAESILFERGYAPIATTLPSSSMKTESAPASASHSA